MSECDARAGSEQGPKLDGGNDGRTSGLHYARQKHDIDGIRMETPRADGPSFLCPDCSAAAEKLPGRLEKVVPPFAMAAGMYALY